MDINILPNLCSALRNGKFVLYDSDANDENRMITFHTVRDIELLKDYQLWFIDEMLKVSPEKVVAIVK